MAPPRETVPTNRRIYGVLQSDGSGSMILRMSYMPPNYHDPAAVLLWRGMLPTDAPVDIKLVSDPKIDPDLKGTDGMSAYQVARQQGYGGTATQWLTTLNGAGGASAYQLARDAGYGGTQAQWLASLAGKDGKDASAVLGTITVSQTATVAIVAGVRRVVVAIPASLGVKAGDALMFCPTAAIAGYAFHDVVAVSATSLSVGMTGPLLAIGATWTVPGTLLRLS